MKKWQKLKRKEDAKKLRKKPKGTKLTPKATPPPPPPPPPAIAGQLGQGDGPRGGKKPFSWKVFSSLFVIVLGFFGYGALVPKILISQSPAVDSGILSYQFTIENKPLYPITMISVVVSPVGELDLVPIVTNAIEANFKYISFETDFDKDSAIKIDGGDSITMKIDPMIENFRGHRIKEGCAIIVSILYKLPLVNITKMDSALFISGRDSGGNAVWIKKPLGKLKTFKKFPTVWLNVNPIF